MSFQTALSGLSAANQGLEVIGNNIANASTVGAKASRAEFSDVYSASMNSAGSKTMALGVAVGATSQSFAQGNVKTTGNDLDLAINGNGFFQVTGTDGSTVYTRAGEFKLNKDGYVVNNNGAKLMGYGLDSAGVRTNTSPQALQLPTGAPISPKQTSVVTAEFNLDANKPAATASTPLTDVSTTLMTYDSQGGEVPLSLYFVKTATANQWDVYSSSNGATPAKQGSMQFNTDGTLNQTLDATGTATGTKALSLPMNTSTGATSTWTSSIDFSTCTQLGTAFGVTKLSQDGWAPGQMNGIKIGADGTITARYSNGQQQSVGQVLLANFRNSQGLQPVGGGWVETTASGQPTRGTPGNGNLGMVQSGAVEESNVDLTAELVDMMTAQRTYQANAQTIKTMDQLMSTLINLR